MSRFENAPAVLRRLTIYVNINSPMHTQKILSALALIFFTFGCSHETPKAQKIEQSPDTRPADELSLKADRSALDEERKQIPVETKRSNDEMALILGLLQTNDFGQMQEPSKIRDRFDKLVRDRRAKMDNDLRKSREDFSRDEKKSRDDYFAQLKKTREDFSKEKHDSETRNQFFGDQDQKRRGFVSSQQEKRSEFESGVREKRKDFEDYIRERQSSFNDEYRSYSKRYDENRKAISLKKNMQDKERRMKSESESKFSQGSSTAVTQPPANQKDLEDLQNFPKTPSEPLGQ